MYKYYTLEECYKLKKELHVPWKYIEECVGIKRTSLGHYKKVVRDPDAIKRASILYTVAIRSYMESGVATTEEKRLFENFESAKAEDQEWGSWEERLAILEDKEEKKKEETAVPRHWCADCKYYTLSAATHYPCRNCFSTDERPYFTPIDKSAPMDEKEENE